MAHHGDDVCEGSCVGCRPNSRTIPTVEIPWGGIFSFRPNLGKGKAVNGSQPVKQYNAILTTPTKHTHFSVR